MLQIELKEKEFCYSLKENVFSNSLKENVFCYSLKENVFRDCNIKNILFNGCNNTKYPLAVI